MRAFLRRSIPLAVFVLLAGAGCGPQSDLPPVTPSALAAPAPTTGPSPTSAVSEADSAKMLIDFRRPAAVEGWETADDGVIGGESNGAMKAAPNSSAVFQGTISQHRGGFVTVHCPNGAYDLREFKGLELRVRGDGRAYQAMVKTEAVETGLSYYFWFRTQPGAWQTVRTPFAQFKGNFRGLNIAWAHLDPAKAVSLGFLIANWQEGPFRLEVESIKAYR